MSYELCRKIRDLTPYEPITGSYAIRLDANESYIELPEKTKADMMERISSQAINRYPDPLATEPCALFAAYHGISPRNVTAGNGSDELLSVLTQSFMMRGERMAVVSPDFSMYGFYGEIAECGVDVFKKNADLTIDVDALVDFVHEHRSRMLIFSNPCNPTGVGISREKMLSIVERCPDCLVVADEAYMDFWDQSVIDCVNDYDNLFVLRTCSKAFRMAGIRCGFAVGCDRLTDALRAVKSPYNVSSLTQDSAVAILARPEELSAASAELVTQRTSLEAELSTLAAKYPGVFCVVPSCTNFVFLRSDREKAQSIFAALKECGIVIRCFGDCLRITAGSVSENAELIKQLDRIMSAL